MRKDPYSISPSKTGVTLVELMISLGIFSVFMTGLFSVFLFGSNRASESTGKLLVNGDIRILTNEMADNARFSDYFRIYDSYTDRNQQNDGSSGDFLVLVCRDSEDSDKIGRIIGYYRYVPEGETQGPVQMFDRSYDPPSDEPFLDLLPDVALYGGHKEVIELSNGLSDGKLFFNFYDRSIIVRGEIIHDGALTEQVTNTYNFTVSPRG